MRSAIAGVPAMVTLFGMSVDFLLFQGGNKAFCLPIQRAKGDGET
jgi:hypothetical protein